MRDHNRKKKEQKEEGGRRRAGLATVPGAAHHFHLCWIAVCPVAPCCFPLPAFCASLFCFAEPPPSRTGHAQVQPAAAASRIGSRGSPTHLPLPVPSHTACFLTAATVVLHCLLAGSLATKAHQSQLVAPLEHRPTQTSRGFNRRRARAGTMLLWSCSRRSPSPLPSCRFRQRARLQSCEGCQGCGLPCATYPRRIPATSTSSPPMPSECVGGWW